MVPHMLPSKGNWQPGSVLRHARLSPRTLAGTGDWLSPGDDFNIPHLSSSLFPPLLSLILTNSALLLSHYLSSGPGSNAP